MTCICFNLNSHLVPRPCVWTARHSLCRQQGQMVLKLLSSMLWLQPGSSRQVRNQLCTLEERRPFSRGTVDVRSGITQWGQSQKKCTIIDSVHKTTPVSSAPKNFDQKFVQKNLIAIFSPVFCHGFFCALGIFCCFVGSSEIGEMGHFFALFQSVGWFATLPRKITQCESGGRRRSLVYLFFDGREQGRKQKVRLSRDSRRIGCPSRVQRVRPPTKSGTVTTVAGTVTTVALVESLL